MGGHCDPVLLEGLPLSEEAAEGAAKGKEGKERQGQGQRQEEKVNTYIIILVRV